MKIRRMQYGIYAMQVNHRIVTDEASRVGRSSSTGRGIEAVLEKNIVRRDILEDVPEHKGMIPGLSFSKQSREYRG